jgi:mRNA interferase YafQ
MLDIKLDKQFKKDVKRDQKSGKFNIEDFGELKVVMDSLIEENKLDDKYLEHKLLGEWRGYFECHLKPNWLLIYKFDEMTIKFARLGTHQQLFKKY